MVPKEAKICPHCRKKFGLTPAAWAAITIFAIAMPGGLFLNKKTDEATKIKTSPIAKSEKTTVKYREMKTDPPVVQESLEYQLATINAGRFVTRDHITVARFKSLLNQLSWTYVEDQQQIADMTVKARQILKNDGIDEQIMKIMEGMNILFPKKIENQKYAEYIAAYATLRSKGYTHEIAIQELQAIILRISRQ